MCTYTHRVCVHMCVCVFLRVVGGKSCGGHWGNQFTSEPGLTFTGKVTQRTYSSLNLPEAYFCLCQGRACATSATVIGASGSSQPCPLSGHLCPMISFPDEDSVGMPHWGSLRETHALLPSLTVLNFDFSTCSPASHLPHSHLPASVLQHIWLMDCLLSLCHLGILRLATPPRGTLILWSHGFWIYLLFGSALCPQSVTFLTHGPNNWCSWPHDFLWCTRRE